MDNKSPFRIEILGAPVDCVDMSAAVDYVERQILTGTRPETVIAVNPEKVIKAQTDKKLHGFLCAAGLLIPDGIGVVVAASILGLGKMQRVPGAELMPAICKLSADKGYKLFLFGGRPEVNLEAVRRLEENYPGINIVGNRDGYLGREEIPGLIDEINASGADVLFLALGSPAQELWMAEHLSALNIKVCQGVGGTFDVISGAVRRAPRIFRRMHLEWLYRLLAQPGRLFRQTALPKFVWQVLRQKASNQGASSATHGR